MTNEKSKDSVGCNWQEIRILDTATLVLTFFIKSTRILQKTFYFEEVASSNPSPPQYQLPVFLQ